MLGIILSVLHILSCYSGMKRMNCRTLNNMGKSQNQAQWKEPDKKKKKKEGYCMTIPLYKILEIAN